MSGAAFRREWIPTPDCILCEKRLGTVSLQLHFIIRDGETGRIIDASDAVHLCKACAIKSVAGPIGKKLGIPFDES